MDFTYKESKKDDDEKQYPYQNLDKTTVLQESRLFNETPVNPRKCIFLITKILYLLGQGEVLNQTEATEIFFNVVKLFISDNKKLRRLLYIIIKELSDKATQTFVAINSIVKDMNANNERDDKANAIRAFRTITDASMFTQIDRHLRQAIVSKSAAVSSAALVTGLLLYNLNPEMIKRWTGEVQSALNDRSYMVQYHALSVLYRLRQHDPLAVAKLVTTNINNFRSPLAHCLLIKYSTKVLRAEGNIHSDRAKSILSYLESCLNYKHEMVILEAARAMCSLEQLSPKELTVAVTALENFLGSYKSLHKFAALRTLNELASKYPLLVSLCNVEMENLISDSNRNIATLAITTLLKTGNENNIDRLMDQISKFMSDIGDEFKITIVDAMRNLCLKYPSKHHVMLGFLNSALREEGGYEFKKSIADTIITIITNIPESKETGLAQLCEFIEDCEFTLLLQQVLHFLGEVGPTSANPSKCIRYIYNRVLLESAPVRASAVVALAKFGAKVQSLRKSILVILQRVLQDQDDEVRDRAVFYLHALQQPEEIIQKLITEEFSVPIGLLEKSLIRYIELPSKNDPFTLDQISQLEPEEKQVVEQTDEEKKLVTQVTPTEISPVALFSTIPLLAQLGAPFKSSKPIQLTEPDSDYVVSAIKHVYEKHIVFHFNVTNKVDTQQLRNVFVRVDTSNVDGLEQKNAIKATSISHEETVPTFIYCIRNPDKYPIGNFPSTLKFNIKDIDPETGMPEDDDDDELDEDEYSLEDLPLTIADFVKDTAVEFKEEWEKLEGNESILQMDYSNTLTLQESINEIIDHFGLTPLNDSNVPQNKKSHGLFFSCVSTEGSTALIRMKVGLDKSNVVKLGMQVRSKDENLRELLANTLQQL